MFGLDIKKYDTFPISARRYSIFDKCKLDGQELIVMGIYEYAIWTDKGAFYVPEALKLKDCVKNY